MPHKLANGKKPSVSNLRVLFCPCFVQEATAHVDTKALNMCHQSKKYFVVSLFEYHNIKRVTRLRNYYTEKISSHDLVFCEIFSSALAYTSSFYSESLAMQPSVLYILYAT